MDMEFFKYHGSGNDFIIVDDRSTNIDNLSVDLIQNLCRRRFGIGADGLILLRNSKHYDFEMVYYNSDGQQSTMCGNGARCIVHFAHKLGIIDRETSFTASDGEHQGKILDEDLVEIKMRDIAGIKSINNDMELDSGSPHYLIFKRKIEDADLLKEARSVRFSEEYKKKGINVNLIEDSGEEAKIKVRTYERGVEDETYSCGTGVVAAAIGTALKNGKNGNFDYLVQTAGGNLHVYFNIRGDKATKVWLKGPVKLVYSGIVDLTDY